ncbi:unnamed protein product, partial [Choristocarpus tenellus]
MECADTFCEACCARLHRVGKVTSHLRIPIEKCVECEFQVAVKLCIQCNDNFCSSCFDYIHRRGRLHRHGFEPLVGMCHECGKRAQVQRCFGCDDGGHLLLCRTCQANKHADILEMELLESHRMEDIPYFPLILLRLCAEIEERAQEAERAAEVERIRKQMQATFKGWSTRKGHKKVIKKRKLWLKAREHDDVARRKWMFKFMLLFGIAKILSSDTDREIVLKQYPVWWEETITDIVHQGLGWSKAASMVREQ